MTDGLHNCDFATLILYDISAENQTDTTEWILLSNQINKNVLFYSNQQHCVDYIRSVEPKKKLFFITSAHVALDILKLIHNLRQIDSVFIFCANEQEREVYENSFSDEYTKIIDLFTDFNQLIESIKENVELIQKETESFLYYNQHQKSIRELSRESALFLWLLLFKDVILELPHDEQAKQTMLDKCQQHYRNNKKQLKFIDEFSRTYQSKDAIKWYTGRPFLYKTINRALRTEDIEQLYIFRYFIVDLCMRLKEEHEIISGNLDEITVYRGTKLSKQEIERLSNNVGKLISTNGYLSTSCLKDVALMFAGSVVDSSATAGERESVLFEIKCNINDLNAAVIFAHIGQFSKIPTEQEVLFDLGATFEILSVNFDTVPLTIKMKAVAEGNRLARDYIQFNREEMEELKSPVLMYGRLLFDIGKFDECQRYFQHLLSTQSNHQEDTASLYVHLGRVHGEKGEYDDELNNYNRALEIMTETGRTKDSATVLNNIGSLYFDKGDLNKSLEYYKKALAIRQKYLPKSHQSTAMSLMNMGFVYYQKFDYDRSLVYHIESLQMKQRILPSDHTLIADSLEHLGNVYWGQKKFDRCLEKYEKTLKMREQLLPAVHIDIAKSLMNLGNVLYDLGRQNEGSESYEKALNIQEKLFPEGHPSVALTLYNISATYTETRNLTLAAKYNERALEMCRRFELNDDHPHIVAILNNASEIERLQHTTSNPVACVVPNTSMPPLSFMRSTLFLVSHVSCFRLCYTHLFPLFSFVTFNN